MSLSEQFLPYAGEAGAALAAAPALEGTLQRLLDVGRAEWPDVNLAAAPFLRHLAERLPGNRDPMLALDETHGADLYLACACVLGDSHAVKAFHDRFLTQLGAYLRRWDASPAFTDDVKQAVSAALLLREGAALPGIANYNGQGPMFAWLWTVTTRTAARLSRTEKEKAPFDERSQLLIRSEAPDPELAYLKARYRSELEEAYRTTLAALDSRGKTILRFHFLDGMNADAIAGVYKVSRRTAERWLAQTREQVLRETRRLLGEKLQIQPSQLNTLLGLVQSEIDVSIRQILNETGSD